VDIPSLFLPAIALYPEIHYRFCYFPFSRYYRRQPEILSDAPHRLEPGQDLPVLLLIKDAHLFPLELQEVELQARCRDRVLTKIVKIGERLGSHWWHRVEWIQLPDESPAEWEISTIWQIRLKGREYRIINDNLPGLSHAPLKVRQSGHPLPRLSGWRFGDLHAHTNATEDQVEFGAPLEVYPDLGQAQGLSFAFAADHAYDLDDLPDSYLGCDPELRKFRARAEQIAALNRRFQGQFALLPGFELTVANHRRRNVHLLMLGQTELLPGSGDSAEKWRRVKTELSIAKALEKLSPGALALAAHPNAAPPFLQRLLLGRGRWEEADLLLEGLSGLQIWNGESGGDFLAGAKQWTDGLLAGRRWKIIAGSDAHGNFSRYRQVGFPMIRLEESDRHVFGTVRTGVYCPEGPSSESVLDRLKFGRSFISDGPFGDLEVTRPDLGEPSIKAIALSTSEFGALCEIRILRGIKGAASEGFLLNETSSPAERWERMIPLQAKEGYLRMEVRTDLGKTCLTNPVYLSDPPP